jgi:hypothetical protein
LPNPKGSPSSPVQLRIALLLAMLVTHDPERKWNAHRGSR